MTFERTLIFSLHTRYSIYFRMVVVSPPLTAPILLPHGSKALPGVEKDQDLSQPENPESPRWLS